jgi:predicted Zn-dependent peptidase
MSYQRSNLDNGLRIASEAMAGSETAAFAIAVDVGARDESRAENGLSHLLEHMAFKGTARLNAKQIAENFDMMGGNVNAYTSHEHTVYEAKVLKEYAGDALRLLCEIVADSNFDESELEREREVILQEIAMHHDTPDDRVFDLYQEKAFGDAPLGRSILGTPEQVSAFTRHDLLSYTANHYQPSRLVIAGAGAVHHEDMHAVVQQFFGARADTPRATPRMVGAYVGGEQTLEKELEQVQIALGFPAVSAVDADYYATQVLVTILGGGMSSRLFQEIREKRGLAYSVSAFAQGYQDVGLVGVYAGTTAEHVPELMGALKDVLATFKHSLSAPELLRAKNQMKANLVMSRENPGTVAEWIARHIHIYGRYRTAPELLAEIDAVSEADIARLADRFFNHTTPVVTALGPAGSVNHAGLAARLAA